MKQLIAGIALLAAACAGAPLPEAPPPASSADPRIGEIQTSLTELLERIDVMNERLARVEEERVAVSAPPPAAAQPSAPAAATQPAQPQASRAQASEPQAPQRALIGAKLAEDYRKAIMLYGRGSYREARAAFEQVVEADPTGDLADNALYWVGETYFAARDYNNAMRYYGRVTTDFADQNKAPDALFKTALAQERTGDLALARRTFQQLIERYPFSTAASSAKHELQRIKY